MSPPTAQQRILLPVFTAIIPSRSESRLSSLVSEEMDKCTIHAKIWMTLWCITYNPASTHVNVYVKLGPPEEDEAVRQESCLFNVGLHVMAIHFQNKKPPLSLHPQMQFVALGLSTHNGQLCPGKIIAHRQNANGMVRPTRRARATQYSLQTGLFTHAWPRAETHLILKPHSVIKKNPQQNQVETFSSVIES